MTSSTHDPRRLTQKGDTEIAYPEHAKLTREVSAKIDDYTAFLRSLMGKQGLQICKEYDVPLEDAEFEGETRWWPVANDLYSPELQKVVFAHFGINYDAFFREKDVMFQVVREAQGEK